MGASVLDTTEKWVSMEDICNHLNASRDTVKKMIRTQNMPAYKFDRKWKFKISEVDAWMHSKNRFPTSPDGENRQDG